MRVCSLGKEESVRKEESSEKTKVTTTTMMTTTTQQKHALSRKGIGNDVASYRYDTAPQVNRLETTILLLWEK